MSRLLRIIQRADPDTLIAAREWLAECRWGNVDADAILDPSLTSPADVVHNVEIHYDGGWNGFATDNHQANGA